MLTGRAKEGVALQEVIVKSANFIAGNKSWLLKNTANRLNTNCGKEIEAKEEKWSYGLYSVLLFQFPDKVRVSSYGNGRLYASLNNGELTLVVIDGIPVSFGTMSTI